MDCTPEEGLLPAECSSVMSLVATLEVSFTQETRSRFWTLNPRPVRLAVLDT